jgi:type IV secretory pathway TrbD component
MPRACPPIVEASDSPRVRAGAQAGQATVELVALLPLIAVLGALLWQAAVAGQAIWLAGSAARAAARASALGENARDAARRVLPDMLERGLVVSEPRDEGDDRDGRDAGVRVAIRIPSVVGDVRLGTVTARARLRDQTR